jgi:3-oxoacyl-[acyl-carrier protein] reductase
LFIANASAAVDAFNNSLAEQTAVVTGSSSGIGRAIALAMARAGANVVVHARANRTGADEVVRSVASFGRDSKLVLADLSDISAQDRLVEVAMAWRPVDVWVNNAGVDVLTGAAANWTFDEKLAALWQVDVFATLRLSRLVGERMKQRGSGVILNMGWDQAETGMEGDSGQMFAAVKGAVMAATRSLAKSLAPQVRVNCLAPGWIRTDWGEGASTEWQERAARESLLARWGEPEDVARVACFLASPAAAFLNGQIVNINGGRS